MIQVKLCGMMRPEDIETAKELQPEYVGFVFAQKSRRYLRPAEAKALKALLPKTIPAVGVFVDAPPEQVAQLLAEGVIDMAQLHGQEDETYLQDLRKRTDKPLIRAWQIRSSEDLEQAAASTADLLLLDAGAGSGTTFNWDWLQGFPRPYLLAGGLTPENVRDAICRVHPYGVDVSSGIETNGRKDPEKMKAFVRAVRRAAEEKAMAIQEKGRSRTC